MTQLDSTMSAAPAAESQTRLPARRDKIRIKLTKIGWFCFFLLVWLPAAAVLTINNFLFLVFGMLVGVVVTSHILARRNIRNVEVTRRFPDEMFAGRAFRLEYSLRPAGRPWGPVALDLSEPSPVEGSSDPVSVPRLNGAGALSTSTAVSVDARGDHEIPPTRLSSSFPFGFATYSQECGESQRVLVFPRLEPVKSEVPWSISGSGSRVEKADPFGTVPFHFRDYTPGDPYKYIDWKKSAHTGQLVTRIFSEEGSHEVTIRLARDPSERAISRAASLVVYFGDRGSPVRLIGPGLEEGPGSGGVFTRRLLTILARWENPPGDIPLTGESSGAVVDVDRAGGYHWKGVTVQGTATSA